MPDDGLTCPSNINREEKKKREVLGISFSVLAIAGGLAMIASDISAAGRLLIFIPAFFGALGLFQARQSLCVFYAYRNEQKMGAAAEPIRDSNTRKVFHSAANRIFFKAASAAAVWTLLVVFL